MKCEVFADGKLVATGSFDRATDNLSYGPVPQAPLCIGLGEITAREFRIVMSRVPANFTLKGIVLTEEAKIDHYSEKLNNKMPYTSTPDWFAYQWTRQPEPTQSAVIQPENILNLSAYLHGDTLAWNVPEGRWRILRIGMTPTMKTNKPTAPWSQGLEIDKMNRRALGYHYDSMIGKIVAPLPDSINFHRVIADSYETGPGSWTDDFRETFIKEYGYDPLPWLALYSGQMIGSAEQSDRFAWDLRRHVADRIASEFVGGLAEVCAKNGTSLWLENYGWDGFPSEFLKYAKLSPAIGGEFWTTSPNVECRLAASACHIYNKNIVYAESYTTGGHLWEYHPRTLKRKGDEAYAEGVNQHIMHVVIHQPYADSLPGVNSWFGIELNRHNTWFEQAGAWIEYQNRCCFMLQQGLPAADVCFFIGEDCPKMAGWKDPALATGYDYDFINADVILNDMEVRNGRLTLPSGVSYALLALPPLTTMRPELLEKIEKLVIAGAAVIGNPVEKSPSLEGFPECDAKVKKIAKRLWVKGEGLNVKNKVFCGIDVNDVLLHIGVQEAVKIDSGLPVRWKQRDLPNGRRIYFITNQSDTTLNFTASFRTAGLAPEWWNPIDGSTHIITDFSSENGYTSLSIHLEPEESGFVVFRGKGVRGVKGVRGGEGVREISLDSHWDITFDNPYSCAPFTVTDTTLFDWTTSTDKRIKYFSGTAKYKNRINVNAEGEKVKDAWLEIENLGAVATVFVNGIEAGTLWAKPYGINIGEYLIEGDNLLEISVSNVWRNRLVAHLNNIFPDHPLWLLNPPSKENYGNWLVPSGIWGKIKVKSIKL